MTDIKLTFINESNDQNNSSVVLFQKNEKPNYEDLATAWKVIKNCATGWKHRFTYPASTQVSATDAWGNEIIEPLTANLGDAFAVYKGTSGDEMGFDPEKTRNTPSTEVQIWNDLEEGSIDAQLFKAGRLLATKTGVSPEQKAAFQIKSTIWIGVVSDVEEGDLLSSAIISSVNTKLGLAGIQSADIIMTGGGTGTSAAPFKFELTNIKYI